MDNEAIIEKLDKLYWTDPSAYLNYVSNLKESGYKVYRNDKGEHKVKSEDIYGMFGGIFGDIFGRT